MYETIRLQDTNEVKPINPTFVIYNQQGIPRNFQRSRFKKNLKNRKMGEYIKTLEKRAQDTNQRFKNQNLPYELSLRDSTGEIFIDLAIKGYKTLSRNITEENFGKIIDDISIGKGLIIDN